MPEIDATHPDVIAAVQVATKDVEMQQIQLPPDVYIEILDEAIKLAEKELRQTNPIGPM